MNELSWALLKGLITYFIVLLVNGTIGVILARLKYLTKTKSIIRLQELKPMAELVHNSLES